MEDCRAYITQYCVFNLFFLLVVVCAVFMPTIVFELSHVKPVQRGFYCDDDSIKYPYRQNTVPVWIVFVVGIICPIIFVSVEQVYFVFWLVSFSITWKLEVISKQNRIDQIRYATLITKVCSIVWLLVCVWLQREAWLCWSSYSGFGGVRRRMDFQTTHQT